MTFNYENKAILIVVGASGHRKISTLLSFLCHESKRYENLLYYNFDYFANVAISFWVYILFRRRITRQYDLCLGLVCR